MDMSPKTRERTVGRRQRKAEATRAAIIDAALTAFERQPIGLVSVLDITEAADVAKGVFYLHFKSKDEFLLMLWQRIHAEMLERMSATVSDGQSRAERIDAVIRVYYEQVSPDARRSRFCLRMSSFLPDEIGAPGRLCELRRLFIQQLGCLVSGDESEVAGATASILDATCWAMLWQPMRLNQSLPTRKRYCEQVRRVIE